MTNAKDTADEPTHDSDDPGHASSAQTGDVAMSPAALCLEMRLHSRKALETIRAELNKGKGVLAACRRLGIGRSTIYRAAEQWPALATMLESKALDRNEIAAAGVKGRNRVRKVNASRS